MGFKLFRESVASLKNQREATDWKLSNRCPHRHARRWRASPGSRFMKRSLYC